MQKLWRFAGFAVDWDRVYAFRYIRDREHFLVLEIFADIPGSTSGEPIGNVSGADAVDVWNLVKLDKRFTPVEDRESAMAVELSKVAAVINSPDGRTVVVSFALTDGRGSSVAFDATVAGRLLAAIPKPKVTE